MRTFLLMICAIIVSAPAYALNSYNINSMTCGQVQSILQQEGQAQLRYTSPRNPSLQLYDRYVSGGQICRTQVATVPTRDNANCRVHKCRSFTGR